MSEATVYRLLAFYAKQSQHYLWVKEYILSSTLGHQSISTAFLWGHLCYNRRNPILDTKT